MVAFHAAENAYFLRKKEPLFSISDTEPQIPTSYNQQEAATDRHQVDSLVSVSARPCFWARLSFLGF